MSIYTERKITMKLVNFIRPHSFYLSHLSPVFTRERAVMLAIFSSLECLTECWCVVDHTLR